MIARESVRLLFILLLSLSGVRAESPFRFKEVRVSPTGQFLGVVLTLYTFDVTISDSGRVVDVEVTVYGDSPMEYRLAEGKIERAQKGLVALEYEGRRVTRIGDFPFRYLSACPGRLESIGDTLVQYESGGSTPGRIERLGGLQVVYSIPEKRIDAIGSLKFEYRRQDRRIERFTRTFRKEGEPVVGLRVCAPEL